MKKIVLCLILLLCLTACNSAGKQVIDPDEKYMYIIDSINNNDVFLETSDNFDVTTEMAMIDGGYSYYITIDNPHIAMYRVEAVAIEKGVDYTSHMAANVGVFEEKQYNIVPNQTNVEDGYVKGIVMSGTTENSETTLYLYVQFYNEDYSIIHSEYLQLYLSYEVQ